MVGLTISFRGGGAVQKVGGGGGLGVGVFDKEYPS